MNICFLMYPWETIKHPENDTSVSLIHECVKRGHGVAICTPANLTIVIVLQVLFVLLLIEWKLYLVV